MPGKKRIFIITGGEWQIPLVRQAKKLGYFVINSNLYSDSPTFRYADVSLVADVLDKQKNLEYAKKYIAQGITTDQSDIAVPTVAYVCEQLGLPGIGTDMADLYTDKFKMREFCRDNGFPTPNFCFCESESDLQAFINRFGLPVIIKPLNSQGSRGVKKVNTKNELHDFFQSTLSVSKGNGVLAEEFIDGVELTVEGIKTYDCHNILAISQKKHFAHNNMSSSQILYKNSDREIPYKKLREQHNTLINQTGLLFGLTHSEYMYTNGTFYLIEMAARGGGSNISSHVVPIMSGINTNELLLRMAFGEKLSEVTPTSNQVCVAIEYLEFPEGKIERIQGLDQIKSLPGLVDTKIRVKSGDKVISSHDDASRHGQLIAFAKNEKELIGLIETAKSMLQVDYE